MCIQHTIWSLSSKKPSPHLYYLLSTACVWSTWTFSIKMELGMSQPLAAIYFTDSEIKAEGD